MGFYPRQSCELGQQQSCGPAPQQSWGMYRDGATMPRSPLSWEHVLSTLAPRDLVTCYQAQGLSGHTSPCGECAYLASYYFSFRP
jgi:hypothetical protein